MSRYPNPLRAKWTCKTWRKSNLLPTRIETQTKGSRNGQNSIFSIPILWQHPIGTQTFCGRIEPPKQDANLTFYVPGLKPQPNDLQMTSNSIFSIPIRWQYRISIYRSFSCLGTQTLCGHIEPPKHDTNLTFYVPVLKPRPKDLEMAWNSIFSIPILWKHRISICMSFYSV